MPADALSDLTMSAGYMKQDYFLCGQVQKNKSSKDMIIILSLIHKHLLFPS